MNRNWNKKIVRQIIILQQTGKRLLGFLFFRIFKFLLTDEKRSKVNNILTLKPSLILKIINVTKIQKFVIECTGSIIPNFSFEKSYKNGSQIILVVANGRIKNVAKAKLNKMKLKTSFLPKAVTVPEIGDKVPVLSALINGIDLKRLSLTNVNIPNLEVNFNLNEIENDKL